MALTTESATLGKRPVEMFSGQLDSRYDRSRWNVSGLHKRLVEHAASGLRERSKRSCVLVYDELQATEVVRTGGGYFVGGEFLAVDLRPPPAGVNRRALDDLPGDDLPPTGKLRWRLSTILRVS